VNNLHFSKESAGALANAFLAINYSFALLGGVIADGLLGQFKTLIVASCVVILGALVIISAELFRGYNHALFVPMALTGIIIFFGGNGTGKPCLSTFLGDQFGPNDSQARSSWFSYFYMSIQIGSLVTSIGVPFALQYFRGRQTYITFIIIFIPLFLALSLFVLNSQNYVKKGARGNVFFKFLKIVFLGCSGERDVSQKHWLDKAKRTYTVQEVEDAKAVIRVLGIFLPLPFFWAVFFQMYSIWVFQAQEMNTAIGGFVIPPSTTSSINGILDILLIPLFDKAIYPFIDKYMFRFTKLRRIAAGHIFTIAALIVGGFVSLKTAESPCVTHDKGLTFVCPPGALHVAWIIPQYFLISCGEILLSISGLEFAYEEAPPSMKGSITAIFQVTTAVGNAMITVLSLINASVAMKDFIFAGIIFLILIVFTFIAYFYKYRADEQDDSRNLNINESAASLSNFSTTDD